MASYGLLFDDSETHVLKIPQVQGIRELHGQDFFSPIGYDWHVVESRVISQHITIIYHFVGVGAVVFYPDNALWINLIGFLLLVSPNILDCVDGQWPGLPTSNRIWEYTGWCCGDIWF
jgi:hypothetical protein